MDLSDLNNLDYKTIGSWPLPARAGILVVLLVAVVGAGWYFDWKKQWVELEGLEKREVALRKDFENKQLKAYNLDLFRAQLVEMRLIFQDMVGQLPAALEIEEFVVDLSQTGIAAGLEVELIRPGSEVVRGFYAEHPVTIRVVGGYHQLGVFVSGIAGLSRIVTLHNITIKPVGRAGGDVLVMDALAKTYRYTAN